MANYQQLAQNAGLRQLSIGQESASKRSKVKKWLDFKTEFQLHNLPALDHTHLLDYGVALWDRERISSACSYVSAAHHYELSLRPCSFNSNQKNVNLVYLKIQREVEIKSHKCTPNTIPINPPFILAQDLSILSFMGTTGIRPVCAENVSSVITPIHAENSNWVSAIRLETTYDKVAAMHVRTVYYVCPCEFAPHLCCIHKLGFPVLPISRSRYLKACQALDSSIDRNYGSRRQHCPGTARIIGYNLTKPTSSWYCRSVKSRINNQLGWVKGSSQLLNYTQDLGEFSASGIELFGVVSGMSTFYLHGKFPVFN